MKKLIGLCWLGIILLSTAFAQEKITPANAGVTYGKTISKANAISVKSLENSLKKDAAFNGKIQGEVVGVCKKSGCFITLKREGGQDPIMVRFTDYAYFVPADIIGKTVVVEGKAKVKEKNISIVADGVLVVN